MKFFQNKNFKFLLLGFVFAFVLLGIFSVPVLAQNADTLGVDVIDQNVALGNSDLRVTVVKIINTVLGLLGIIAVVLVLYGGFTYMTAGGDDEKVSRARKILINSVIGLVIILSAFGITKFVLNKLSEATGLVTTDGIDTTLDGDCDTPGTDFYDTYHNTSYCQDHTNNYPEQSCSAKHFIVKSITPSTKEGDVLGMNNGIVRALFSKPIGSDIANAIKIEKDGNDITGEFEISFKENNYVIEAVPKANGACDIAHCLITGNYTVTVLQVKDKNGNELETTTDCGDFPNDASFQVGDETNFADTVAPIVNAVTLDNQTGESVRIVSGREYPVNIAMNDRENVDYGGGSYVVLTIFKEDSPENILKTYVNAPPVAQGSSQAFSFDYGYLVKADLVPNSNYVLNVAAHDIDSNIVNSQLKFQVVAANCDNGVKDGNETDIDSGGSCGGALGSVCSNQNQCSISLKCLDTNDNLCSGTGDCVCKKWPYIEKIEAMDGAPGNWITIQGRNFGNSDGEIYFNYNIDGEKVSVPVSLAQCLSNDVWHDSWVIAEVPEIPEGAGSVSPSISIRNSELSRGLSGTEDYPLYPNSLLEGRILNLHLDETEGTAISDTSGANNNLELVGNLKFNKAGKFSKAFDFDKDADSSGVEIVDSGFLRKTVAPGSTFDLAKGSVFAWIKKDAPSVYQDTIVSRSSTFGIFVSGNNLAVGEWYNDGRAGGRVIDSGVKVVDGEWHLVGLVFDGENRNLYVDGKLVFTVKTQFFTGNTDALTIGANNSGSAQFYKGFIDEVNIWNRVLSDIEVATLYHTPSVFNKFVDFSNDNFGPNLGLFKYNENKRPGLCAVNVEGQENVISAEPKTAVVATGKAFGDSQSGGRLVFGSTNSGIRNWSDQTIGSTVPFANPGKNAVYVEVNGQKSNTVIFNVLETNNTTFPVVTQVNPTETTPGSYITISGKDFGGGEGVVSLLNGSNFTDTQMPPVYCGTTWEDDQIIVKIPEDVATADYNIVVTRTDGKSSESNASIKIVEGNPLPSICKITPDSGSAPLPNGQYMTIKGDNLSANPEFYFWQDSASEDDYNTWLKNTEFQTIKAGKELKVKIPVDEATGLSMSSGPIVVSSNDQFSNGINYEVVDCRLPGQPDLSNSGFQCCQAGPEAGVWKDGSMICRDTLREAGYAWRFATGKIPERFEVLEQCEAGSNTVVPSPTPWSDRNSGKSTCINAQIQVVFSLPVDTSTVNTQNVKIFSCGGDFSAIDCNNETDVTSQFVIDSSVDNTLIFKLNGQDTLSTQTWYRVALSSELKSKKSVSEFGSTVEKNENLESTKSCDIAGGNYSYCFDFRTGGVDDICTLVGAGINPSEYTTRLLGVVQDVRWPLTYNLAQLFEDSNPNIHPKYFDVYGIANQECIVLNVDDKPWQWGPVAEDGNNPAATALKSKDDLENYQNSRGKVTAWENSSAGTPIYAKLNLENGQVGDTITVTSDILEDLDKVKPYTINSADDAFYTNAYSSYFQDGNFDFTIKFTLADIPTSTSGFAQDADRNWKRKSVVLLNNVLPHGNALITQFVSNDGTSKSAILNFKVTGRVDHDFDLYLDNQENILNIKSEDPGKVIVSLNDETISFDYSVVVNNSDLVIGTLMNSSHQSINNKYLFYGTINSLSLSHKEVTQAVDNIEAKSTIKVDLGNPQVVSKWPVCTEVCLNAEIGMEFNQIMLPSTYDDGGLRLFECANENCASASLTPVNFTISSLSNEKYLKFSSNNLATSTWYLVKVLNDKIYSSGGLKSSVEQLGSSAVSTEWKFKTKASSEPCVVNSVEVTPDPFVAYYVGQKNTYTVSARGEVDACSTKGQLLDPWDYGWQWSVEDPKVAEVTNFSISGNYNDNICTSSCLPAGSDITREESQNYAICGNGVVDSGEDCDIKISLEIPGVSCTYNCLRPGNSADSCGDGIIDYKVGEECDPATGDLSAQYCSGTCLRIGSTSSATGDINAPVCGSGSVTTGEDCDINDPNSKLKCSNSCLNLGTSLSQDWCDRNYVASNAQRRNACNKALSICGNNSVEAGEECEIGTDGADENTCDNRCLLKNVCNNFDLKQCNKGDEGCIDDCTWTGSSLSYSEPSVCGDGKNGIGEPSSIYFDGSDSRYNCELPVSQGGNALGSSPTQLVTALGNFEGGVSIEVVEKMTTKIFAKPINYYSSDLEGNKQITAVTGARGEGEYDLMCGYKEYDVALENTYNNCPNNPNNELGVATNSCCYNRPIRSGQYPAVNAGIGGGEAVCRNTYLEVDFDRQMDKLSFNDNILIIEGYDRNDGYVDYKCEEHGQKNITDQINSYLSIAPSEGVGFWGNIWNHVKSFFANLFSLKVFAAPVDENNHLSGDITWCATDIKLKTNIKYVYDYVAGAQGENKEYVSATQAGLILPELLDSNVYVLVILQGGKNGIKDSNGVGLKDTAQDSNDIKDSWLFKTGDQLCKIDHIDVSPVSKVFYSPNSSQEFTINVVSKNNGQLIVPVPDAYEWTYSWYPSENDIFNITNTDLKIIDISPKGVEGSIDALAKVEITKDIDTNKSQVGETFAKVFKLQAFFCSNPWPSHNTVLSDPSFRDVSLNGKFAEDKFNFSFLYCADEGNPLVISDDLPLFNDVVYVDNPEEYGLGDTSLRSYLLFSQDTTDAVGIQIFENTPDFKGQPRSLENWYIDKFGDLGDMKLTSVAGYEALSDNKNYYISVFDVDKTINSLGTVYNYVILFSLSDNSNRSSSLVFEQIINNLNFNTKMTEHNKCLPNSYSDSSIIRSDVGHNITNIDCQTDFDCRDGSGVSLIGTSGYCSNEKTKFYRDLNRLVGLRLSSFNLDKYFNSDFGKDTFVANLDSGSYITGYTTSKWQNSWGLLNSYAGTVAQDPINDWVGCGDNDSLTCWNVQEATYTCPQYSQVYEYQFVSSTKSYEIYAPFEYLQSSQDADFVNRYINQNKIKFGGLCKPGDIVSGNAGVCGDGVVNYASGEECEPPGSTKLFTYDSNGNICSADKRATATCNVNTCRWNLASSCESRATKCGNGIIEGLEVCDDGISNGSYGYCNERCTARVAYCGDSTKQDNEFCDKGESKYQTGYCELDKNREIITSGCFTDNDCKTNYTEVVEEVVSDCSVVDRNNNKYCTGDRRETVSCDLKNNNQDCHNVTNNNNSKCLEISTKVYNCVNETGALIYRPLSCSIDDNCLNFDGSKYIIEASREVSFEQDYGACKSPSDSTYDFKKANSCSFDCTATGGYCGDGITQWSFESCDDGNTNNNDLCKNDCTENVDPISDETTSVETASAYCGDGKISGTEQCDLGASQNGVACTPAYNNSCTYCSNTCVIKTVEASQRCGNGSIDKDASGNWLEACDYKLDANGNQTIVYTHDETQSSTISCSETQKGNYQCANNCQDLKNQCITCGVDVGLPQPQLAILNPLIKGTGNGYSLESQQLVTLYKKVVSNNPSDSRYNTLGYRSINYNFASSYIDPFSYYYLLKDAGATQPNLAKGIETNPMCNGDYKLFFNVISSSVAGGSNDPSYRVYNWVRGGYGDFFDYPVNGEDTNVKNDVIMSPAVPRGQIRIIVRSEVAPNDGYDFVGNFMFDNSRSFKNIKFANVSESNKCGNIEKNSSNYWVPAQNCIKYGGIAGNYNFSWVHPIIKTEETQIAAYTFDFNNFDFEQNDAIGFYVTSPNVQINSRLSDKVWVDVYLPKVEKDEPEESVYKPDHTFSISNAEISANEGAPYWHVFNFYVFTDKQVVIEPIGQNIQSHKISRTSGIGIDLDINHIITSIDSNITENYGGAIVTQECQMRDNIPNTQPCE